MSKISFYNFKTPKFDNINCFWLFGIFPLLKSDPTDVPMFNAKQSSTVPGVNFE